MKNLMLAISLIGIFLLLIIIKFSTPEIAQISSINLKSIGEEVKITGNIISFREYENDFKILNVGEKNSLDKITVTCNCPEIKFYLNKTIEITGKVEEYKGHFQISADKVSVIQ